MRRLLTTGVAEFLGLTGWAGTASAKLFSDTGPVIAILAGDLFHGEATGKLDGSGTVWIQSRAKPDMSCRGQFTSSAKYGGVGSLKCSDGATVDFQFKRVTLRRGHGFGGTSAGPLTFTYGMSAADSAPYLKAPPGKSIKLAGTELALVDGI